MSCRVDLLEHPYRDVRVNLRCVEPRMTEHLLYEADVRAAFEHQRCHRVAEEMTSAMLADSGRFDVLPDDVTERGTPQRFALHGQEQGHVVRLGRKPGPRLVEILVQPRDGPLADWDYAILHALALADGHDARCAVHVVEFEIDKLRAPHLCRVKRLQHRAVAQPT